jgi:hypothetical protein
MKIPMKEELIFHYNQRLIKLSCRNAWPMRVAKDPRDTNYGMLALEEQ